MDVLIAILYCFFISELFSNCGYLHDYSGSDVIQGVTVKFGYFPTQAVLDNPELYVRKWYKDNSSLDPDNDPNLKTSSEPNNEFVLTIRNVDSYTSGGYRVRCTENRPGGDNFTNTVQINVIGNVGFIYITCIYLILFKCIQCFIVTKTKQ